MCVAYLMKASLPPLGSPLQGVGLRAVSARTGTMWNDKAMVETGWLGGRTKEPPSWC